ncbi:hypothetical protein QM806_04340 [Rhodococcus sp. IEGM 1351]|uniref:hypothetical protein n=1 Tax=Rhodococcus sp. IEGM 1351 TaxID=3047089 RepID=UPI0024B69F05|nr:hypothetical protein [Rhodococcus sp. IEGM 1351]MDI9934683.1 hypothetical protein [Rhodococcus sp. IEGM 1351]
MALNIVAHRKVSLKGFGQGWDDCYLLVKAANPAQVKKWRENLTPETPDDEAEALLRNAAREVIVSGQVITTEEDGTTQPVTFDKADVPTIEAALDVSWLRDVVTVSSGSDRLKA